MICFNVSGLEGEGYWCCTHCRASFQEQFELTRHVYTVHRSIVDRNSDPSNTVLVAPPSQRLDCAICGKLFKNINTLRNHRSLYHKGGK